MDRGKLNLADINQIGSAIYSKEAKSARDNYTDYFNKEDSSLPWQIEIIKST